VKITEKQDLAKRGAFAKSTVWRDACRQVEAAIRATDWPHGSGKFTIRPESGKERGRGSGVVPIKKPCISMLKTFGWKTEDLPPIEGDVLGTGDLDALLETKAGFVGFEWETGNISSSHRAVNKLLLAIQRGGLRAGILVVPSDELKKYLTDRIGNIGELRPYFPLWKSIPLKEGILRIYVVEHDSTDPAVARIPKGTDGRARD